MPIWYCLVSSLVSSNTWFRSTDELCEAARAWQNIYLLGRWNLYVETDNLPSNLHHLSFTQISYPSTNIDKFILTSAKNRNVPFKHNIFCIGRFRGRASEEFVPPEAIRGHAKGLFSPTNESFAFFLLLVSK